MIRILSNIFLLVAVFLFPIYLSIVLILFFIFSLDNFFESIIFAYILDLLYSGGSIFGINFPYSITLLIFIVYLISFRLKTILRLSLY